MLSYIFNWVIDTNHTTDSPPSHPSPLEFMFMFMCRRECAVAHCQLDDSDKAHLLSHEGGSHERHERHHAEGRHRLGWTRAPDGCNIRGEREQGGGGRGGGLVGKGGGRWGGGLS